MRIKKYVVNSMPDAMQQIRSELGNNAIILNTKKIKTGGWFGFFSKQQIEVIAAVDQEKKIQKQSQGVSLSSTDQAGPSYDQDQMKHNDPVNLFQEISTPHSRDTIQEWQQKNTPVQEPLQAQENKEQHEDVLLQELRQMKRVMSTWITEKGDQLPAEARELHNRLKQQGVVEELRTDILAKALSEIDTQSSTTTSNVLQTVRSYITGILQASKPNQETCIYKAKMVCFVGPTGVGKTTTIAKLAAEFILKQKKKVGFITSDTYRIAAVEQLKTYASILQIPLEVIFSPDELEAAMAKLQDCDVILMDTAGRNYKQQQYISELSELIPDHDGVQIHMVLSLTTKFEDMVHIVDQFKTIKLNGFILTKLDETNSYGSILNLLHRFPVPLSYLTNGQNVPDDILLATPETITDLMLGEFAHERSS